MADPSDGLASRAPELEDLVELCRRPNEADARYVLIGGFAVILHGYVRGTKDIDLLVDAGAPNIRRIKNALAYLEDNAVAQVEDDEVERYAVVRVADEIVIDLMAKAGGIDFEQAVGEGGVEHVGANRREQSDVIRGLAVQDHQVGDEAPSNWARYSTATISRARSTTVSLPSR